MSFHRASPQDEKKQSVNRPQCSSLQGSASQHIAQVVYLVWAGLGWGTGRGHVQAWLPTLAVAAPSDNRLNCLVLPNCSTSVDYAWAGRSCRFPSFPSILCLLWPAA